MPLQVLAAFVAWMLQNVVLFMAVLFMAVILISFADNQRSGMAMFFNTYNSGIGAMIDVFIKGWEFADLVLRNVLPIYNCIVWWLHAMFLRVLLPFAQTNINLLPAFLENLSLSAAALGISLRDMVSHISDCALANRAVRNASTGIVPFTSTQMQCAANVNYIALDLMTPGMYVRETVQSFREMVSYACPSATLVSDLVMYPLLDFNFYKLVHTFINILLHWFVGLPLITSKRCDYARSGVQVFTAAESSVMCVPDFVPSAHMTVSAMEALGDLLDNWLNVIYATVENTILGRVNTCEQYTPISRVWKDLQDSIQLADFKIVGVTASMYAITNGNWTRYHSLRDGAHSTWAPWHWPFVVDTTLGVAAVKHSMLYDADADGDTRTGLFACRCLDTINGMQIICASVPFALEVAEDLNSYNTSTIHYIHFAPAHAARHMRCSLTQIKVSAMRYSKKRHSQAVARGLDAPAFDSYSMYENSQTRMARDFTADAAIHVQPMCSNTDAGCLPEVDNCYPWCMGLHVSGQQRQNITLYNALTWDQYVNVANVDCVIQTEEGRDCESESLLDRLVSTVSDWHGFQASSNCLRGSSCVPAQSSTSQLPIEVFDDLMMEHKRTLHPSIRTQRQPFVVAGDIMLTRVAGATQDEIVVSRLYDHAHGSFTVEAEQLTLLSNARSILITDCEVQEDWTVRSEIETCYAQNILAGVVVMPRSSFEVVPASFPAVSSRWAVHWAVNPELSQMSHLFEFCTGVRETIPVVASSFSRIRVWSLKTTRVQDTLQSNTESPVSYMVVPDALGHDTKCTQQVALKVVDMEWLNEENILITVLRAAPRHYVWQQDRLCDGCEHAHARYFLHPNRHDCVSADGDSQEIFSCWRTEDMGPWPSDNIDKMLYGKLCPAMRRMPDFGSAVASALSAASYVVHEVLTDVTVLAATWASGSSARSVFQVKPSRVTFHSALDSYGQTLFDFEKILDSIDRFALHVSNIVVKLGNMLRGLPASDQVIPRIIGVQKVLVYSKQIRVFRMPVLNEYAFVVTALPSDRILEQFASLAPGMATKAVMNFVLSLTSTMRFNAALIRELFLLILLIDKSDGRNAMRLVATSLYTTQNVFRRQYLDMMRVQCDGIGQIIGVELGLGQMVRHLLHLVPDTMESLMNAMLVMLLDYPLVDCVCRLPSEHMVEEVIDQKCLKYVSPINLRAWTLRLRWEADNTERRNMCFAAMDGANTRLKNAFDLVLSRLDKLTISAEDSIDTLLVGIEVDAGKCHLNSFSQYVLTLLPEPVDYFMGCMHTRDCRIRCLDTYNAFEESLARVVAPPIYTNTRDISVKSLYFSNKHVLEKKHLPPFTVFSLLELPTCDGVCATARASNRCIVAAGTNVGGDIGVAYFCLPDQLGEYITESILLPYQADAKTYPSIDSTHALIDIHFVTSGNVARGVRELILLFTYSPKSDEKALWLFDTSGLRYRLLHTTPFDLTTYNKDSVFGDPSFSIQNIHSVRVIPSHTQRNYAVVFVLARYMGYSDTSDNAETKTIVQRDICLRAQVSDVSGATSSLLESVSWRNCDSYQEAVVATDALFICLNIQCSRLLRIPMAGDTTHFERMDFDLATGYVSARTRLASSDDGQSLLNTIGVDPHITVYTTMAGEMAANRRRLSVWTTRVNGDSIDVLLAAASSSGQRWIQNIAIRSSADGGFHALEAAGSDLVVKADYSIACSIENCIGCQVNPARPAYVDVQSKCYAAAQCAISRCVGTTVNLRRPLCNAGKAVATAIDVARIALGMVWTGGTHIWISTVELTHDRRREYSIAWPEDYFMAGVCTYKDAVVEISAVLMSIVGGIIGQVDRLTSNTDGLRSRVDSKFNARVTMNLAAVTNFMSTIFMAPILMLIAGVQTVQCMANDVLMIVQNLFGGEDTPRVIIMSRKLQESTSVVTGYCLSQSDAAAMRELGTQERSITFRIADFITSLQEFILVSPLEPLIHFVEAFFAYVLGVFVALGDWVQTIDWYHCKLPSMGMSDVGRCVCGDKSYSVVQAHAKHKIQDNAFWCTGPLLMPVDETQNRLVWNPYSLQQLLATTGLEEYVRCLSTSFPARCKAPNLPNLKMQKVEILEVITRCRSNYQQMRWDEGSALIGIFSLRQWQERDFPSIDAMQSDDLTQFRLDFGFVERIIPRLQLDEKVHACLSGALAVRNAGHACHIEYLQARGMSVYDYFMYEPSRNALFVSTDSCETFSGGIKQYSEENGASMPVFVWSGSSSNKIHVAELHTATTDALYDRVPTANAQLDKLLSEIRATLLEMDLTALSDDVDVSLWSVEADDLHQLVDCVLMGPYASADMFPSFTFSNGDRLPVPQYHRGDPSTRDFIYEVTGDTQGSRARQHIIQTIKDYIAHKTKSRLEEHSVNRMHMIRSMFQVKQNFLCECIDGPPDLVCCVRSDWRTSDDIKFGTRVLFENLWDLKTQVMHDLFNDIAHSDVLKTDIWTNHSFVEFDTPVFTQDQAEELRHAYLFRTDIPIMQYSTDEVLQDLDNVTLWQRCTQLLSASFFTMPLRSRSETDEFTVDADTLYDPTKQDSDAFLHGVEEAVQRILARAREDSPVFWSHQTRYVASDSVWCENMSATPLPQHRPSNVFQPTAFHGTNMLEDTILGHSVTDVKYPAMLGEQCVCGWSNTDNKCVVPQALCLGITLPPDAQALQFTWDALCAAGTYTTREDAFDVLQALHTSTTYQTEWFEDCTDTMPSVVWGLLSPEEQHAWYTGNYEVVERGLDMQHMATRGPSGLRIGLIGRHNNSLLEYLQSHRLYEREPSLPPWNARYKHTVAQPVCERSLHEYLSTNLTEYFMDVLFPMAHTIHDAPASAFCSRWVIEHALLVAFEHIYGTDDTDVVLPQLERARVWRLRCNVQVQQLGMCMLRGVFDLIPKHSEPVQCPFSIAESNDCGGLLYTTSQCIVMCNGVFYDPCLCDSSQACDTVDFSGRVCARGRVVDVRKLADNSHVQLQSMQWPHEISQNELGDAESDELAMILKDVRARLQDDLIPEDELYDMVHKLLLENTETESTLDDIFCDDLTDYWNPDAQHPVGYHPSSACDAQETNIRGFASWMSVDAETSTWAVDPFTQRNSTLASTVFGAAHLVCDAHVYGALGHDLNPYYLQTRWSASARADPSIPRAADFVDDELMQQYGDPTYDYFDTPLTISHDMRHSAGLVRNWMRTDKSAQATLDESWPHTASLQDYGFEGEESLPLCSLPPLHTCQTDTDCTSHSPDTPMKCMKNAHYEDSDGICMQAATCFQHTHCAAGKMCSGEGRCVKPRIHIRNKIKPVSSTQEAPIDIQLFCRDANICKVDTFGLGLFGSISDFAQAHGMCSYRNWHNYHKNTENLVPDVATNLFFVSNAQVVRSETNTVMDLFDTGMLHAEPHACDRDYHHAGINAASGEDIIASWEFAQSPTATQLLQEDEYLRVVRTWSRAADGTMTTKMCNMKTASRVNGFLYPYTYQSSSTDTVLDTLEFVPNTIAKCSLFQVCPAFRFYVDAVSVGSRRVMQVEFAKEGGVARDVVTRSISREYSSTDADICTGMGYLVSSDEHKICIVDRYVMPLIDVVFSTFPIDGKLSTHVHMNTYDRPMLDATYLQYDQALLSSIFDSLLGHCPSAFNGERSKFVTSFEILTRTFLPKDSASVLAAANQLLGSLFGLPGGMRRFSTLDEYIARVGCLGFIIDGLAAAQQIASNERPYITESLFYEPSPGSSLYYFNDRAPVFVPIRWMWQCVLISDEHEGGAPINWYDMLTADSGDSTVTCPNFQFKTSQRLTLRKRLQTAAGIFTLSSASQTYSSNMREDITNAITRSLDVLRLTSRPNTQCMRPGNKDWERNESCSMVMHESSCWQKCGAPVGFIDDTTIDRYGRRIPNIYDRVFEELRLTMSAEDFVTAGIEQLLAAGVLRKHMDLDALVSNSDVFIPVLSFAALDTLTEPVNIDDMMPEAFRRGVFNHAVLVSSIDTDTWSLSCMRHCSSNDIPVFLLKDFEFAFTDGPKASIPLSYAQDTTRATLTIKEAVYVVLSTFKNQIYDELAFRGNNLHMSTKLTAGLMQHSLSSADLSVAAAREYNDFMRNKQFECGARTLLLETETNLLHAVMRACQTNMKETVGWGPVGADDTLTLDIPSTVLTQGFYLAYKTHTTDGTFLDNLTSADWSTSPYTSSQDMWCYATPRGPSTINPYWAEDYDIVTGCDMYTRDGVRYIDTRCVPPSSGSTCAEKDPFYDHVVRKLMPAYCSLHADQAVFRPKTSSLRDQFPPLCTRRFFPSAECEGKFGSFHNAQGTTVSSLFADHTLPEDLVGLWNSANYIMRANVLRASASSQATVLKILETDIAGHSLQFDVDARGWLTVRCVNLKSTVSASCTVPSSVWMQQLEDMWAWQHALLLEQMPVGAADGPVIDWRCPLQRMSAYGNSSKAYAVKTPNTGRNAARFRHITQASKHAHPTVASVSRLSSNVHSGYYLGETQVCVSSLERCRGYQNLKRAVQFVMSEDKFTTVEAVGIHESCAMFLDWPHTQYTLRDGTYIPASQLDDRPCNIFDRLPAFGIRQKRVSSPRPAQTGVSTLAGGACKMQRLARLHALNLTHPEDIIQECSGQKCTVLPFDALAGGDSYQVPIQTRAAFVRKLDSKPRQKGRLCRACDVRGKGTVFNPYGPAHAIPPSLQQLSIGVPTRLNSTQTISALIRRHVCPVASRAKCDLLEAKFNVTLWTQERFLQAFLARNNSAQHMKDWQGVGQALHQKPWPSDEALWARPWVFCNSSGSCKGSIEREIWREPASRPTACAEGIIQSRTQRDTTVKFCQLDHTTEKLCRKVVEWNLDITRILCETAGMPDCPRRAFFYNPTMYSLENQEFVHDTVTNVYKAIDASKCPVSVSDSVQAQMRSNEALKKECASSVITSIVDVIRLLRTVVRSIIDIIEAILRLVVSIFQLVAGILVAQIDVMRNAADDFITYLLLLFAKITQLWITMLDNLTKLLLKTGIGKKIWENLVQPLCRAFQWVVENMVGCTVTGTPNHQNYECGLEEKPHSLCAANQNMGLEFKRVGDHWATKTLAFWLSELLLFLSKKILALDYCGLSPVTCDADFRDRSANLGDGALFAATRCWSSYVTFFGDSSPLSCTNADTCRRSITDSTLQICSSCAPATLQQTRLSYGCDFSLKMCTCDVPKMSSSYCYSNAECNVENVDTTCRYLDSELELTTAFVPCDSCQTTRYCYQEKGMAAGVCACGLFSTRLSSCAGSAQGEVVMLPYNDMCLYQADKSFTQSTQYTQSFMDAITAPCMRLDPSNAFCSFVFDMGVYSIVGTFLSYRRHLLFDQADHAKYASLDALCQDALLSSTLLHVQEECEARMLYAHETLRLMRMQDTLPPCIFCSTADLSHAIAQDPARVLQVMQQPFAALVLLQRHTALRHVFSAVTNTWKRWEILTQLMAVEGMDAVLEITTTPSGVTVRAVHAENAYIAKLLQLGIQLGLNSSTTLTATQSAPAGRRLLSIESIADVWREKFAAVLATHDDYTKTLSSSFEYNYPNLATENTQLWLENWPPTLGSAGLQCDPLLNLLKITQWAVYNTSRFYSQPLRLPPVKTLAQTWPKMPRSSTVTVEEKEGSNIIETVFLQLSRGLVDVTGLSRTFVADTLQALTTDIGQNLVCDLEAVQTCSKWNTRIMYAVVVVSVAFSLIFIVLGLFNLTFAAALLAPLFVAVIMYMAYGYSITCIPLVPTCFLRDIIFTLRTLFPKFMLLPASLRAQSPECSQAGTDERFLEASCLKQCDSTPFQFDSAYAVMAWMSVELRLEATAKAVVQRISVLDSPRFQVHLQDKHFLLYDSDTEHVLATRVCGFFSLYYVIPYVFLLVLVYLSVIALLRTLSSLLFGIYLSLSTLFVATFVR